MSYIDKLVDTQDAVMHGEDHNDGGSRLRKQSGEVYATDPPRPSTFLEGDFNRSWTTSASSTVTPSIP
jgi:hypothetical protein